jgi:hypothetical protein
MSAAIKNGHAELALSLSRGLVTTLSGSSAENTLQLYRYYIIGHVFVLVPMCRCENLVSPGCVLSGIFLLIVSTNPP